MTGYRTALRGRIAIAAGAGALLILVIVALASRWDEGAAALAALAALAGIGLALPVRSRMAAPPAGTAPLESAAESAALPAGAFPDPAIVVDRRSVVLGANAAARAALPGLRDGQPLALALREPAALEALAQVGQDGEARAVEVGGRIAGEPVWEVRLRPLGSGAEPPRAGQAAVALFMRDLSAERRFARMQVDFVANVSHELRTPLASLSGFIDTLRGPARDDPGARDRFLGIMGEQASRMRRLIDDLLRLSRVELNEHLAPTDRVDLGAAVSHMVATLAPLAETRSVVFAFEPPAEAIEVRGDRDEILRLVENLLENAVKYGGSGGRVEIAVGRTEEPGPRAFAALDVRDHGPGIAPEHVPRLTERFYRVDVGRSRQEGGTGLGLAIVKHIVGRCRGRLAIESEPGRGALFRVLLPLAPEPE